MLGFSRSCGFLSALILFVVNTLTEKDRSDLHMNP